jgi:peroxiredoxin
VSSAPHASRTIREGDVVPDVALLDHTGAAWRFSEHRGTPLLVILHRHLA